MSHISIDHEGWKVLQGWNHSEECKYNDWSDDNVFAVMYGIWEQKSKKKNTKKEEAKYNPEFWWAMHFFMQW